MMDITLLDSLIRYSKMVGHILQVYVFLADDTYITCGEESEQSFNKKYQRKYSIGRIFRFIRDGLRPVIDSAFLT